MPLSATRLKNSLKSVLIQIHQINTGQAPDTQQLSVIDTFANGFATSIVDEIKSASVIPTALVVGSTPVTGTGTLA